MQRHRLSALPLTLLASLLLATSARAQIVTVPAGPVADGFHGPFLAGTTYKLLGQIVVQGGAVLTVEPGAVVKAPSSFAFSILVDGTLNVQGTALNPVVFTSYPDDSAGADLDGGLSVGLPGQWTGIQFRAGSAASTIDFAEVRFAGGQGLFPALAVSTDIAIRDTLVLDTSYDAIDIASGAQPTIERCGLHRNRWPIRNARFDNLKHLLDNTAFDNTGGNYVDLAADVENRFFEDANLGPENLLNSVIVTTNGFTVVPGVSVTLRSGVVVKLTAGKSVTHQGTLRCLGSVLAPVVFTSLADDGHAGDTNGDGTSILPSPGDWQGFGSGSVQGYTLEMEHALVRFGGNGVIRNGNAGSGASISIQDTIIEHSSGDGIEASGANRDFVVTGSILRDNGGTAMRNVAFEMLPSFGGNVAEGNAGGDYLHVSVSSNSLVDSVTVTPQNYPGEAFVLDSGFLIASGESLTLGAGVVVKMATGGTITVDRNADVHFAGTAQHPVILTALTDDTVAGDTNGDGAATQPLPGQGAGLAFAPGIATPDKVVTHTRLRYAPQTGLSLASAEAYVRSIRVDASAGVGVVLSKHEGTLRGVEVWNAGGDGIQLAGSSLDLRNATVTGSGGDGIRRTAGVATVSSAVSWDQLGQNYSSLDGTSVTYSLGAFHGISGNLDTDPLFVDAPNGDLALQPSSPCVDAGDPSDLAGGQDVAGAPRLLDGDLNGSQRLDMGAHEFSHARIELSGDSSLGGTFFLHSTGTPGLPALILVGPQPGELALAPYGTLFIDVLGGLSYQLWPAAPTTTPLTAAVPFTFVAQLLAVGGAGANLSNPLTIEVE